MKKRVSAFIEKDLFRHAKQRAAQEGRSLGALIQDALVSYLSKKSNDPRTREKAYQLCCERPMHLSRNQFNELLKEESFKPASKDTPLKVLRDYPIVHPPCISLPPMA
jgi:hypothetical protein